MSLDASEFWSDVSTKYDATVDAQLGPQLRRLVGNRLSQESKLGRTLELGCGTGHFTKILAERAERVVATDIAPAMLATAQAALHDLSNVSYQVEDCVKTSFDANSFDTVFMALVLQFVEAEVALREVHRVLKPGGAFLLANLDVFALSVPMRLLLVARTLFYSKLRYRKAMPRVSPKRLHSAARLRAELEAAGFRVEGLAQIRDTSCAYNCPVNYVRAVRL